MFRRNGQVEQGEIGPGCPPDEELEGGIVRLPGFEVQGGQLVVATMAESEFEDYRPKYRPGGDQVQPGTFYGGRLLVLKGTELGLHCHVYETRRNTDTGLMLTVKGEGLQDIYAERHRVGKVKKPLDIFSVGQDERLLIAEQAVNLIGGYAEHERRHPSKHAALIHSISRATA